MDKDFKFETLAVHGNIHHDDTGATNTPIYLSNAYHFQSTDHAADLFNLQTGGYIYTRLHNPTTTTLEETITKIEGGIASVAASTGHSAELMTITALAQYGDNIISSSHLYGGTHNLFANTLKKMGIEVRFVNQEDISSFEKAVDEKTKAVFVEAIPNPSGHIVDFEKLADICHSNNIPLIVDNTAATPYLFQPIKYGADIVVHSCTKYLDGHSSVMGGVIVDSGNFDWKKSGRFPQMVEPDESYHGISFTESFGNMAFAVKLRVCSMRDMGCTISPFNSYMILNGITTLHVRMDRHIENTYKLIEFLQNHKNVSWVNHPSINNSKDMVLKYFPKGAGAVLTFGIKGGMDKCRAFIENLKLTLHAANFGDTKTIVTHPASTTHRQLSKDELIQAGIKEEMIRVSVGIENIEDIINDFNQALDR